MPEHDEFLKRLQAAFTAEAAEHCQALSSGLLELEQAADAQRPAIVETMFRSAHSLKGAARAVNLPGVESICQRLESVFEFWRRERPVAAAEAFDRLHKAVDVIRSLVQSRGGVETRESREVVSTLLATLDGLEGSTPVRAAGLSESTGGTPLPPAMRASPAPEHVPQSAAEHSVPGEPAADQTVRIATGKVEQVLYAAEELLVLKSAFAQRSTKVRESLALLEQWRREWDMAQATLHTIRQAAAISGSANGRPGRDASAALELIDRADAANKILTEKLGAISRSFEQDRHTSGKLIDSLLDETKKLLLLPFSTDFAYFSRLVRDLARHQDKEVDFIIRGGEVEIDKRILQELKDPLVHVLRNCIDHGLERPADRVAAGKPTRGMLTLAATRLEDQKVEILVEDDGVGIDVESVRRAAVRGGVATESALAQLPPDDVLALIFRPEVTTAPAVTEVSGRGLGLAIVWEKAAKLGGRVQVSARRNGGTSFRLILPVTQATFRGILVAASDQLFIVPAARVERVQRTATADVRTIENRDTILVDQRPVAFMWLADALELPRGRVPDAAPRFVESIVLGTEGHRVAFGVDTIVREEEVLVKPLRKPLNRVRNVVAATILGSGRVVPILNVADLLQSAVHLGGASRTTAGVLSASEAKRRSILVAEDSITSRMLLKNILESAGYAVKTAVDGLDALTTLRAEPFDLVVSDVEMPRLNGFALTAAIRADRKLAELPVILVTALASREDRERGIDVGANAYLVKSDFDQSNLLEAVRRLV